MEIRNDFQENDDNAPKLVESKKKQPAITGPMKVLFLDDNVPHPNFFSAIHLFAKQFVANNMQNTFNTVLDIHNGKPTECVGSGGCYATYFSILQCKEQDVEKVVSAINDADVIVCGKLSENILGFNFGLDTNVGPFAEAIAERVRNGFKNVIRYCSKGDVVNYLTGFEELPPIIEQDQHSYEEIFKLIKSMQPKQPKQPKRKRSKSAEISITAILALLGLEYGFSESSSPETSRRTGHLLK